MYRYQIPTMSRKHMNQDVYAISHLYLKDWRYTSSYFCDSIYAKTHLFRVQTLWPPPHSVRYVRLHLMALIGWFRILDLDSKFQINWFKISPR